MKFEFDRIRRARQLFTTNRHPTPDLGPHSLSTTFRRLDGELHTLAHVARQAGTQDTTKGRRLIALSHSTAYSSFRVEEVLGRLGMLEWIRTTLAATRDPQYGAWFLYGSLGVKDFHADVASLMDSLAPVVLQVEQPLPEGQAYVPGWKDIAPPRGSRRKHVPTELLEIIDSAHRAWWSSVQDIRHALLHRPHRRLMFGGPADGFLFQIYERRTSPGVVLPELLWTAGKDVADFNLYSAFVVSEVLLLLDDVGKEISRALGLSELAPAWRSGDHSRILVSIDRLIQAFSSSGEVIEER